MSIDTPAPVRPQQPPTQRPAEAACRYQQSQPQSAELLRLALARMGQHAAAFNPVTFAVFYEHVAGINPRLSQAIEHCERSEPKLSDAAVQRLHREHIADIDEAAAERISGGFQRVMQGLAESVVRTGESAGTFGQKLGALAQSLETDRARAQVGEVLASTAQMQGSVQALQGQLSSSQREIEKLRSDLQRSRQEAVQCPLTGVLNRAGFDRKLQELLRGAQGSAQPACLVLIDIDHFKKVNDGFGHVIGDRVLEALGTVLRASVTEPSAAVARYGGEEFALLLPGCKIGRAVELAESVRQRVKGMRVRQRNSDKVICTVTVSAGVASWCAGDDATSFIARADAALYAAKEAGRDRVLQAPLG